MTRRRVELEATVEDDVVAWAENRGWLVRKMVYPGRRGCPDRWFFKDGRLVIIEFKRPSVVAGNPQQVREHRRFTAAGWTVHVINCRDAACQLLEGVPFSRD